MRNFDDILREKLYEATDDYSNAIWNNIKGEIPIQKKSNATFFWMASFLLVFVLMITMVQQYPNWKIETEHKVEGKKTAELDVTKFILSPEDLTLRQSIADDNLTAHLLPNRSNVNVTENHRLKINPRAETFLNNNKDSATRNLEDLNINRIANENAVLFSFKGGATDISSKGALVSPTSITAISKLDLALNIPPYSIENRSRKSKGNEVHCEVLRGKNSRYYISARHISSYAFNTLESKSEAAGEYMTSRHITESKRYSFTDELNFGVEYRSGFFAELGIRYDQINEQFNFLDPNAQQESTVITIDTIYTGNNPTVQVDTFQTVLAGEREILSNNKFRKLSIPFSIGYEYPLNKKVSLAAKAGMIVNVHSTYNGRMFDENLNVVSISDRQASNNPLFNKLVHSVSGSAFLQYQMNKNMEFLVGVNAYKNLSSASYDTNPIDQKYSSLGIFVGGKYNL